MRQFLKIVPLPVTLTEFRIGGKLYGPKTAIEGLRLARYLRTNRVQIEVWVDAQTFAVRRVVLIDAATGAEESSTWVLTFGKFGQPVTIEKPIK